MGKRLRLHGCILQATRAAMVNMKSVYGGQYVS
jgi:hypothetical protein